MQILNLILGKKLNRLRFVVETFFLSHDLANEQIVNIKYQYKCYYTEHLDTLS